MFDLFPDIRSFSNALGWTLSGGQLQMVAVARGLMAKPRLLLAGRAVARPRARHRAGGVPDHLGDPPQHHGLACRAKRAHGTFGRRPRLCAGNRPHRARRQAGRIVGQRSHRRRLSRRSCQSRAHKGSSEIMVTIQVQNLIDFVAEVFAHSDSSPEEARRIATYLTTANLTGHDSHGVIRVPVYIRWKKMGSVVPDQTVELAGRHAVAGGDRRQVRLWTDGHAAGGQDRHREMQGVGAGRGGAAQCRPYRPRRRLGRNGRRRRAGVDPFRQRRGLAAGRALWRRREAAVDRALLRRHSAPGPGSDRAGFRHLDRRRRQGAGRKPRRQEIAEGRAGRSRRHA